MFGINIPIRRTIFYSTSVYCTYHFFTHIVYNWGELEGNSMFPTFPAQDCVAVVNNFHRYGRGCKVGDIIQFKNPSIPGQMAAKRILGMPGDYVVLDKYPAVSVGDAKGPWTTEEDIEKEREEPKMIQVPPGHVWVLGDNLAYSRDSRFFGPLPMGLIVGKIDYSVEKVFDWRSFRRDQLTEVPMEEID